MTFPESTPIFQLGKTNLKNILILFPDKSTKITYEIFLPQIEFLCAQASGRYP